MDPGFLFGVIGAAVAVVTLALQWLERRRVERETVRADQVAYLSRRIEDLERANQLCEMRCEELREDVLDLMSQVAIAGRRMRRKRTVPVN